MFHSKIRVLRKKTRVSLQKSVFRAKHSYLRLEAKHEFFAQNTDFCVFFFSGPAVVFEYVMAMKLPVLNGPPRRPRCLLAPTYDDTDN